MTVPGDQGAGCGNYTDAFYRDRDQASRASALEIAALLLKWIKPRSVVDLGCGVGTWLAAFKELGVEEILGADGPWVDTRFLQIPRDKFIQTDLALGFRADRKFDLAISLEMAEHLPPERAETLVDSLVALSKVVLFSCAIPSQGGINHLNEQWPDYWVERFRKRGYVAIDCIRPRVWEKQNVIWWYAQNTLLYVQKEWLERYPALTAEAKEHPAINLRRVHPGLYAELQKRLADAGKPENLALRQVLPALPRLILRKIMAKLKG